VIKQITKDSEFLESIDIMDYSLLLAIEPTSKSHLQAKSGSSG